MTTAPAVIVELNVGEGPDKEEIETSHSLVVAHKTTLTRLIRADSKPSEGLLLKKLSVLLATFRSFPVLNVIQKANESNMVTFLKNTVNL